jgi:hypothetical protein
MRRYWTCRKCGHRNDRTASRKCVGCGGLTKPKLRVPKHAETLRDTPYDRFAQLSVEIHGGEYEACGVCGKLKPETHKHDRDHDHREIRARGLACVRCNRELLRNTTLEEARLVVAYLERVQAFYAAEVDDGEAA